MKKNKLSQTEDCYFSDAFQQEFSYLDMGDFDKQLLTKDITMVNLTRCDAFERNNNYYTIIC